MAFNEIHGSTILHLSSRAQSRDLQFYGPFVEMLFDKASWKN
jgi:hypothetical protein